MRRDLRDIHLNYMNGIQTLNMNGRKGNKQPSLETKERKRQESIKQMHETELIDPHFMLLSGINK